MTAYKVPAADHGWWIDHDTDATCCEHLAGAHERNATRKEAIAAGASQRYAALCPRCDNPDYDEAVTGPNPAGACGPGYCHYALSN